MRMWPPSIGEQMRSDIADDLMSITPGHNDLISLVGSYTTRVLCLRR